MEWPVKGYFTEFHHTRSQTANIVKGNEVSSASERTEREIEREGKFREKQMD